MLGRTPPWAMDMGADVTVIPEWIRHIMPSAEQMLAQIGGAKYFSKLDANSGYWQIELDPVGQTHHLHHSLWEIFLQSLTLWDHVSS